MRRSRIADARRLAGDRRVRYPGPGARAHLGGYLVTGDGRIANDKLKSEITRQGQALLS